VVVAIIFLISWIAPMISGGGHAPSFGHR